jgi:hypothetical protein
MTRKEKIKNKVRERKVVKERRKQIETYGL